MIQCITKLNNNRSKTNLTNLTIKYSKGIKIIITNHHIIISGFGIYGAAVVPDSGVGNTWQR